MIRIGTRSSKLAMRQTEIFVSMLNEKSVIDVVKTSGDTGKYGGEGIFVDKLNEAILEKKIDVSVNSMKDVPYILPKGIAVLAVLPRGDPRDAFVGSTDFYGAPAGTKVGSSSPRRINFIINTRRDLVPVEIRGNVNTRLGKIGYGVDALILSKAALDRMNESVVNYPFDVEDLVPMPNQGAIGILGREEDLDRFRVYNDEHTSNDIYIERRLMGLLNAGCNQSIGIYSRNGYVRYGIYRKQKYYGFARTDDEKKLVELSKRIAEVL